MATTLEVLTWGGCPVIFDVEYVVKPDDGPACLDRNAQLRETLESREPSTIVFAARLPLRIDGTRFDNGQGGVQLGAVQLLAPVEYEGDRIKAVQQAVTKTIEDIMAMGPQLILVYPIPEAGWDVPQMVRLLLPVDRANAEQWLKGDGGSTSLDRYINRAATSFAAYDAVPDDPRLHRVYPQEVLCVANTKRCLTHSESEFYYSDDDHLSLAGARLVVGQILKAQF